jgi:Transposase
MKLFVGIDVSSQDMKACVMNLVGETLSSLTVENNLTGASYLRNQIVDIARKNLIQEIQIGMEATSVYSWHPAMFFHEDESLKKFNTKVFTIEKLRVWKRHDGAVTRKV